MSIDSHNHSQTAPVGVGGQAFLGEVFVVQLVHVLTCDHLSPAVLVDVVDSDQATAAGVSVGSVVDGFAA